MRGTMPRQKSDLEELLLDQVDHDTQTYVLPSDLETNDGEPQSRWHWIWIIVRVSMVGFLINCQPSEPYLTRYLKEDKHLTDEELNDRVWPVDTYGAFAFLLPIAILSDVLSYRIIIFAGLICRQLTRMILLFLHGVDWMATMQVTYAAASGVNSIYFAYIYLAVPSEYFAIGTVVVHASFHLGNALGSGLAQLLVEHTSVRERLSVLFYLSWAFSSAGLLWFAFLFPPRLRQPPPSLYRLAQQHGWRGAAAELKRLYTHKVILRWSLWWLFGYGAAYIVSNYYQNQYYDIDPHGDFGTVAVIMEVMATLGSCALYMWPASSLMRASAMIATTTSLVLGLLYIGSIYIQKSVYASYVFNTAAVAVFSFQYAAAANSIASCAPAPRQGLLFALNSFVALAIITVAQAVCSQRDAGTSTFYFLAAALDFLVVPSLLLLVICMPL